MNPGEKHPTTGAGRSIHSMNRDEGALQRIGIPKFQAGCKKGGLANIGGIPVPVKKNSEQTLSRMSLPRSVLTNHQC